MEPLHSFFLCTSRTQDGSPCPQFPLLLAFMFQFSTCPVWSHRQTNPPSSLPSAFSKVHFYATSYSTWVASNPIHFSYFRKPFINSSPHNPLSSPHLCSSPSLSTPVSHLDSPYSPPSGFTICNSSNPSHTFCFYLLFQPSIKKKPLPASTYTLCCLSKLPSPHPHPVITLMKGLDLSIFSSDTAWPTKLLQHLMSICASNCAWES